MQSEVMLPLGSLDITVEGILDLMRDNFRVLPPELANRPDIFPEVGGLIQVMDGTFTSAKVQLASDHVHQSHWVFVLRPGEPHGFGSDEVYEANQRGIKDSQYRLQMQVDPKLELTKILDKEAADGTGKVSGPFTVLLMHTDGSISDYSDRQICSVPEDARHADAPSK
jgi:hypothetical protein